MDSRNLKWELIESKEDLQHFAVVDYNGYTVVSMAFCDPSSIKQIVEDHNRKPEVLANYIST